MEGAVFSGKLATEAIVDDLAAPGGQLAQQVQMQPAMTAAGFVAASTAAIVVAGSAFASGL